MASVMEAVYLTGQTLYAHVRNSSGHIWNGSTFEAYSAGSYANYDVAMSESGSSGYYTVAFPTAISAGKYTYVFYRQSGGSPAQGDEPVGTGSIEWNGTEEVSGVDSDTAGTFGYLKEVLADDVGAFDTTNTEDSVRLGRFLNRAYQEICGEWPWPFLRTFDIIQTVEDITTGTVSVSAGGSTVTFSSAPAASVANRFIQFEGSNDWYEITAHTAAASTATIDPAYGGTSALSGADYIVRKIFYAPTTSMDAITGIRISQPDSQNMVALSRLSGEMIIPFRSSTGSPQNYILSSPDSSGNPRFSFYPSPDDVVNVYVTGTTKITEMSLSTDAPLIPPKYHNVLLNLASFYALEKLDDTRSVTRYKAYANGLQAMKTHLKHDLGAIHVMNSVDSQIETPAGPFLPGSYDRWAR